MPNRTSGRIIIPRSNEDLLKLAGKIYKKHLEAGEDSPFRLMHDHDWDKAGPVIEQCRQNHEAATEAAKLAEKHYRQRDVDLPAIRGIVQNSAALLKSIYAKNPKLLGDYGLTVHDSKPQKKTKPDSDAPQSDTGTTE